jgi:hypothetical protein
VIRGWLEALCEVTPRGGSVEGAAAAVGTWGDDMGRLAPLLGPFPLQNLLEKALGTAVLPSVVGRTTVERKVKFLSPTNILSAPYLLAAMDLVSTRGKFSEKE